jgi:hypothetical protein
MEVHLAAGASAGPAGSASPAAARNPGVIDLYREIWQALGRAARRVHAGPIAELSLVVLYVLIRSLDAERALLGPWLGLVVLLGLVSPLSGLVVLAAVAPFGEGWFLTRDIGAKPVIAAAIGLAIAVRFVVDRGSRVRPALPLVLALALLAAMLPGLAYARYRFGFDFAFPAAQIWFQGIATALIVFVAAAWAARNGERRALVVALAAASVAGIASLADYLAPTLLRDGVLAWTMDPRTFYPRLTGVTGAAVSTAGLVMTPLMVALAGASAGRDWRFRLAFALLATPLLVTAYLTYNRALFVALFGLAVILAWRHRRRLGMAVLVGGIVLGAVLAPVYIQLRGSTIGGTANPEPGQALITSDVQRLTAWWTATKMFAGSPLIGQGYRAYRELAVEFGDPALNAPHNEWLRLFAENGVFVGLIGIGWVVATVGSLWQRVDWLGSGILAAYVSFVIAASVNNPFLFNQVTIIALTVAGTGVALAGSLARDPAQEPADGTPAPAHEPPVETPIPTAPVEGPIGW